MPQLDEAFYPSQLFWLAVTFALLYFVLAVVILPRIERIQSARKDATLGRRQNAEQAASRAETALQNYETKLAEHKNRAQAEGQELRQQTDAQLKKQRDMSKNHLDEKIEQAEKDIASFLPSGHQEAERAAQSATQDIVRALTDQEVADEEARAAIQKA